MKDMATAQPVYLASEEVWRVKGFRPMKSKQYNLHEQHRQIPWLAVVHLMISWHQPGLSFVKETSLGFTNHQKLKRLIKMGTPN